MNCVSLCSGRSLGAQRCRFNVAPAVQSLAHVLTTKVMHMNRTCTSVHISRIIYTAYEVTEMLNCYCRKCLCHSFGSSHTQQPDLYSRVIERWACSREHRMHGKGHATASKPGPLGWIGVGGHRGPYSKQCWESCRYSRDFSSWGQAEGAHTLSDFVFKTPAGTASVQQNEVSEECCKDQHPVGLQCIGCFICYWYRTLSVAER